MKLCVIVIVMLIETLMLSTAYSTVGFQDVLETPAVKSPLAPNTLYNGVTLAGKRLISVGQRGHIVYSDDQGKNWIQATVPVSSDLVAVYFATPLKGWVVGHDGVVLVSADGGATWIKQIDGRAAAQLMVSYYNTHPLIGPDASRLRNDIKQTVDRGANKPFLDVWFENESNGFIIGAFNLIFHTTDGGKNWEPWIDRTENVKRLHFYAIRPVGQDLYVCGEQGMVLKLERKTGKFREVGPSYKGTFFGITGNQDAVIVYGLRGNAYRSKDGGSNWQKIETGVTASLTGSTVTDDGRIFLVSQAGHLLVSSDNGANFSIIKMEQPFPVTAVVALDNKNLMLTGFSGMQKYSLK